MKNKANDNLNLQLNWRFRLFLFLGVFGLTFLIARYLFKSDIDFSLFLSLMLAFFQSITTFAGVDVYALKKSFPNYSYQSFAYLQVNPLMYCPGRLVITERKLIFLTNKWNAKPHIIELEFENIKNLHKSRIFLVIKNGLCINTKNGQSIKFLWVKDIPECIEVLKTMPSYKKIKAGELST